MRKINQRTSFSIECRINRRKVRKLRVIQLYNEAPKVLSQIMIEIVYQSLRSLKSNCAESDFAQSWFREIDFNNRRDAAP